VAADPERNPAGRTAFQTIMATYRGRASRPKSPTADLRGRQPAEPSAFIEPCDPTLREHPPRGDDWVYEIKADGYRAQVHVGGGRVRVYSRRGLDWTGQFTAMADAAAGLRVERCILDGEAVVYGTTGRPDFQALRRELGSQHSSRLRYHAFDLLALDGKDVRELPYVERKRLLRDLLDGAPETFIFVDYLEADGEAALEHACRMGLEGLVAKQRQSTYRSGRVESWIKLNCVRSDTFPIVASVEKLGVRPRRIASLYIGRREGDRLLCAGKAQSGSTRSSPSRRRFPFRSRSRKRHGSSRSWRPRSSMPASPKTGCCGRPCSRAYVMTWLRRPGRQ
jgi:bifunctional non-homologous end joining protein LigD